MGRCADVILTNHQIPHVSIFVNAPFEVRVRRVMKQDNLDYKSARKFLKKVDHRHRSYYEFFHQPEVGRRGQLRPVHQLGQLRHRGVRAADRAAASAKIIDARPPQGRQSKDRRAFRTAVSGCQKV